MSFGAKNILGMVHTVATGYDKSNPKIKIGYITAYDPARYAVRVRLEPESYANEQAGLPNPVVETNWIQLYRPFGGNTWGYKAPPKADPSPPYGDQALVVFPDGGHGMAFVGYYNNVEQAYTDRKIGDPNDATDPKPVTGEFQYVHKTGSFIKFRNDGTVMIFGKPQGLSGFPGSSLLYLTDDGEIELRDSENNYLKMFAKHQNTRIEIQDENGNHIRLVGPATTTKIAIDDTSGNFIHMGPNTEHSARIIVQDGSTNRLELSGTNGARVRLVSLNAHVLEYNSDQSTRLTSANGASTLLLQSGAATISVGAGGVSGIVTLSHLASVVAQINQQLSQRQGGSSAFGTVVAEASTYVYATD